MTFSETVCCHKERGRPWMILMVSYPCGLCWQSVWPDFSAGQSKVSAPSHCWCLTDPEGWAASSPAPSPHHSALMTTGREGHITSVWLRFSSHHFVLSLLLKDPISKNKWLQFTWIYSTSLVSVIVQGLPRSLPWWYFAGLLWQPHDWWSWGPCFVEQPCTSPPPWGATATQPL